MSKYLEKKEKLRNQAIEFQVNCENFNYSYSELLEKQTYFEKMGKKYGLLKEFHENGIC